MAVVLLQMWLDGMEFRFSWDQAMERYPMAFERPASQYIGIHPPGAGVAQLCW